MMMNSVKLLPVRLTVSAIRGYKILISPLFTGSCRFLPSCSDYARDAVVRYGVCGGGWLAAKRLARCHPFCAGGYDPIPENRPEGLHDDSNERTADRCECRADLEVRPRVSETT